MYQNEDKQHEFLAKVHEGDTVRKIWDVVKYFQLTERYPIEFDNVTKRAKLTMTWLTIEELKDHIHHNDEIRASHAKVVKEEYKAREREAKTLKVKADKSANAEASADAGAK